MVERPVLVKNGEQFPLLKVAGAGDSNVRPPTPSLSTLWNSSCLITPRRPWKERWPEYLSTCWMSLILLGVSFLVFYAVGMVIVYRHEAYYFFKCNDNKYASDVYFHHVIPRGTAFPLSSFSDYLGSVATRYPTLRINVIFLVDDSRPNSQGKGLFYNKLYPYAYNPSRHVDEFNAKDKRDVKEFERKHQNVNITVMNISRYMSLTPMKYNWRNIPIPYLPFYVRVFTVWLGAGVGLDLALYNEHYKMGHGRHNQMIDTILKQHSTEVHPYEYIKALNNIERQEETEFLASFAKMIQKMFNETFMIINKTLSYPFPNVSNTQDEPVSSQRDKREVLDKQTNISVANISMQPFVLDIIMENATVVNVTKDSSNMNVYNVSSTKGNETSGDIVISKYPASENSHSNLETDLPITTPNTSLKEDIVRLFLPPDFEHEMEINKTEWPQIVFFYDFSVSAETIRPDMDENDPKVPLSDRVKNSRLSPPSMNFIAIESEGSFVASPTQLHPFLASVMAGGCRRMHPKFAIQNALLTQCSGIFRDEQYCNNIYVL